MGTQDFFIGGMEPFASIAKELQVLTVFFLFENQEQFQKFFTTQYYADAEAKLAENNIVAINKAYNWVTAWLAAITPECNYWTPGF